MSSPARAATAQRLVLPGVFLAMLLAGLWLTPVAPGEGLRVAGVPAPELCLLRSTTGVRCPGCGLTRSWVAAVHGEAGWSVGHHRVGWLVFGYLLLQTVRHLGAAALPAARSRLARAGRWLDRGAIALAALLVLAWVPTLVEDVGRFF